MKCAADATERKTQSSDSWGKRQWPPGTCSREGIFKQTCRGSLALTPALEQCSLLRRVEGTSHSLTATSHRKQVEEQSVHPERAPQRPTVGGDGVKPKPVQELTTEWDMLHGLQARTAHQQRAGHQPGHERLLRTSGRTRHSRGEELSVLQVSCWGQSRGRCPGAALSLHPQIGIKVSPMESLPEPGGPHLQTSLSKLTSASHSRLRVFFKSSSLDTNVWES